MGNTVNKNQAFMEQRERSNTEHRKQGSLAMNLVREEFNRDIQEVYDLRSGALLGKGGFGTVRVVTHKETQNKYALKTIELKDVETHEQYEFLLNEIEIMKRLDHPNIARVQEVFHTPDHVYMVMDLYTGGDMYARYKFRSEDDTAKIVNKLINALRYCHDRNVAHRDIKLENICFESMADDAEVKLVDFGLSASFKDEQLRHDLVGSWAFMAPEVLQRAHHPQACDLWSMGVITYCLLAGFPPFRSVNLKGLYNQILFSNVSFEEEPWKNVTPTAKDFITKLLKKDPRKRLTAQQAQQHPWLCTRARSNAGRNAKLSPKVVDNLRQFKNLNLMKRVALGVVARTLEASEMRNLEQEFHKADMAKSGVISIEDFRAILLRSNQFRSAEVDEIFDGLDTDSSGQLSYTDFTAAALDRQSLDQRRLKYAFERLDHDNNGELSYEDLMMTVGSDLSNEDVRTAIKQFDLNGQGKVSFDDFCKGMRSAGRSTGGTLDALSTAQLTSGYMMDSIMKGEGAAAIQSTLTELEYQALLEQQQQQQLNTEERESAEKPPQVAASPVDGKLDVMGVPTTAVVGMGAAAVGSVGEATAEEVTAAERATAASAAVGGAGAQDAATTLSAGAVPVRTSRPNSVSSSSETASMSRPQSLDRDTAAAAAAAATSSLLSAPRPTSGAQPQPLPSSVSPAQPAVAGAAGESEMAAGGEAGPIGAGGAEATAPVPRKWSKEVSPVGGGRADPSDLPQGWAGEKGGGDAAPAIGVTSAPIAVPLAPSASVDLEESLRGGGSVVDRRYRESSLSDRRMRDSIRLRGGVGGLAALGIGAANGAGGPAGGLAFSQSPSTKSASTSPRGLLGRVSPTSSPKRGPPGTSSIPMDSLALPPLAQKRASIGTGGPGNASVTPRGGPLGIGGALGAAAASAKSGGEPAERNRSPVRKRTVEMGADLPPRDSTAGEADLGWGEAGLPPDLKDPPSTGSSSTGTESRGPRTPKSLRFGADTSRNGGKARRSSRKRPQERSLFCGRVSNGGGGGTGGDGGNYGMDGDTYRDYDNLTSASGLASAERKRAGTFCMPSGNGPPFWVTWMESVFGGPQR